jgi:hypothetical protein
MIVLIIIDRLVAAKEKLLLPPFQLQCKSNKKDGEAIYNFNSFCYIRSMKALSQLLVESSVQMPPLDVVLPPPPVVVPPPV